MPRPGDNQQVAQRQAERLQGTRAKVDQILQNDMTAFDLKNVTAQNTPEQYSVNKARKNATFITKLLRDEQTTQALQLTESEIVRLKSMRARSISHLLLNEHSRSDSPEMAEVKYYVSEVEELLDTRRAELVTETNYEFIQMAYRQAINACDNYLNNPKKNKNSSRYEVVSATKKAFMLEADRLDILRGEVDAGMFRDKTIADLMGMQSETLVVRDTQRENKVGTAEELSKDGKYLAKYFDGSFVPSKELKKLKGSDLENAVDRYRKLRNALRKIPAGRVVCIDTELLGRKVKLLQRADNSLYIVENHKRIPLGTSAVLLADHIEQDIMLNSDLYGEDVAGRLLNRLNPDIEGKKLGERQRIRQMCIDYIVKRTGIHAPQFTNYSVESLLGYAKLINKGDLDADKLKKILTDKRQKEQDRKNINSNETLDLIKRGEKLKNADAVIFSREEVFEPADKEDPKVWSKKEKQILELFADLFFDSETWTADEKRLTETKGEGNTLRLRLAKHRAAMVTLLKEPDTVKAMINKLDIPGIELEDGADFKEMMLEKYEEYFDPEKSVLGGVVKAKGGNAEAVLDSVFSEDIKDVVDDTVVGAVMQGIGNAAVGIFKGLGRLFGGGGDDEEEEKEEKEEKKEENKGALLSKERTAGIFDDIASSIGDATKSITDNLQRVVSEASDKVFGSDKEEKDPLAPKVKDLDTMMEELIKGKKGVGRFNKLVMKSYFGSVSEMDKRAMVASMIRNLKPEAWAEKSREEYIDELKKNDTYSNRGLRFDKEVLSPAEEEALKEYAREQKEDKLMGNMLGGILKGAGPLMHKVMQGLPIESMPSSLKEAIKDMKSNLAPIPEEVVKSQLNAMIERSRGGIKKIEVVKSLGAASIGQTFLCRLYGRKFPNGKEVAVKLLRPDVRNRMMREKKIMLDCARQTDENGGMHATYLSTLMTVQNEMDLTIEAGYVKQGEVYNGQYDDLESMKLNDIIEPTTSSLVAEKAEGKTVDSYLKDVDAKIEEVRSRFFRRITDKNGNELISRSPMITPENVHLVKQAREDLTKELESLKMRRDHVLHLADVWVQEGMTKSGFYHGDLHAGNIMVDDNKATIIDFGNSTQLTPYQEKHIIAMLVAAMNSDVELYMDSFVSLLEKKNDEKFERFFTDAKKAELKQVFTEVLNLGTKEETGKRIMVSLLRAQELGLELPASVWGFAQGQSRLMNTIDEMNKKISSLTFAIDEIGAIRGDINNEDINVDPAIRLHHEAKKQGDLAEAQKQKLLSMEGSLNYADKDELMRAALDITMTSDDDGNLTENKAGEFEQKYMEGYRYVRRVLERDAGKKGHELYTWQAPDDINFTEGIHFDSKKAAEAMRKYLDKYRDNPGTMESRKKDCREVERQIMPGETLLFNAFGGDGRLIKLLQALQDFDVEEIEEGIRLYSEVMPLTLKMAQKFEELRIAQSQKKSEAELNRLNGEFADLYMQVQAEKNDNNEALNQVRARLYTLGDEDKNPEKYDKRKKKLDAAINRLADRYPNELGAALKSSLTKFRRLQTIEGNGGELPEGEVLPEGMTVRQARKQAERELLEAYRKVALKRVTDYKNDTYANVVGHKDERGFLDVMGDILGDKWLVTKMAWKVRWKLGYRIYTSDKHGEEQRREYEAAEQQREEERRRLVNQRAEEQAQQREQAEAADMQRLIELRDQQRKAQEAARRRNFINNNAPDNTVRNAVAGDSIVREEPVREIREEHREEKPAEEIREEVPVEENMNEVREEKPAEEIREEHREEKPAED